MNPIVRYDNFTIAGPGYLGPSYEPFAVTGDPSAPANWRASLMTGGSPGWDGAPGLAGDYNHDDIVDGADFLVWQQQLGAGPQAASVRFENFIHRRGIADVNLVMLICGHTR